MGGAFAAYMALKGFKKIYKASINEVYIFTIITMFLTYFISKPYVKSKVQTIENTKNLLIVHIVIEPWMSFLGTVNPYFGDHMIFGTPESQKFRGALDPESENSEVVIKIYIDKFKNFWIFNLATLSLLTTNNQLIS